MKRLGFKFEQNRTISDRFDFLRGEGGGARDHHLYIIFSIIIGNHMKMFRSKFQQNRTLKEEFDFWWGREGSPIHKFESQLLLANTCKGFVSNFSKIRKSLIQNGSPNPQ